MQKNSENLNSELPTAKRPFVTIEGDVRDILAKLPENTFQCCVTSPPYWGVRDYGHKHQIGAEPELKDYIKTLVKVFREVRRVLKPDGTFWLNIGNTYTSGGRTWRQEDSKNRGRGMSYRPPTPKGLKDKDLIGVAWMLAMECQLDGWYLRNDIIWYKPNCQPESVKDRLTVSHEYLFLLTKSEKYSFHQKAIQEQRADGNGLKNKRTVWSINTKPYPGAHFAVFPPDLVRPCIMAGSSQGDMVLDPFVGSGTVGLVALELGRKCLGIEIQPDYLKLAGERVANVQLSLNGRTASSPSTSAGSRQNSHVA